MVGVYCHFCGETGSGGRYYGSNENIAATTAVFTKRVARAGDATSHNCKCNKEFKGRCNSCEGDTFVDDGELGSPRDFSNFGGDRGFSFSNTGNAGNDPDPIRGFMGNGSAPPSALDQPDHGNATAYGGSGDQY